ncbi:ABC-2 type transport system ATP-binding protein [Clostridium acidisoli DSM 12555]|uniref:ABC-2 type transport system ATP-binding protein n=1 Tax=Clostridium acidisoli DSM 12555 TaxID=1121291 RepID=A0A1W1WWB1_9CLOT|nr:ABC transporter ATP-binding protein [Clostridium acidisoli]SMC16009.1 ABC-2 type transport system ATP-binding protein [Clostridium acidisoli DSM 12555]
MIKVKNLKKIYETKLRKGFFKSEKTHLEAVKNISMEIEKGKIVGLLGINGAGKTTTIKMLSTLLLPTSGSIDVDGIDAIKNPMIVKKRINMVAGGERMIYWRLTGRENLWYYGQIYGIENKILSRRIDELLRLVGITEKQDTPVENYSKGMKQRLQIARGLINNPDYIFMDEPTLGLDALIAKELRSHVKKIACEEGKGILLTSHYMEEIEELCDYVYILNKGEIIEKGTPKQLATLGLKNKTIYLKVEEGFSIYEKLCSACSIEDKSVIIKQDNSKNVFTITSALDLNLTLSKFCMSNNVPIIKLYEEEPKLEDAIIRFAKEA